MFVRVFLTAALAMTGTVAFAQDAVSPAPAEQVKEKKICRAETATGSIMAKRVCRTKTEWAKFNEQNEKQNENFRDRQSRSGGQVSTQ